MTRILAEPKSTPFGRLAVLDVCDAGASFKPAVIVWRAAAQPLRLPTEIQMMVWRRSRSIPELGAYGTVLLPGTCLSRGLAGLIQAAG